MGLPHKGAAPFPKRKNKIPASRTGLQGLILLRQEGPLSSYLLIHMATRTSWREVASSGVMGPP